MNPPVAKYLVVPGMPDHAKAGTQRLSVIPGMPDHAKAGTQRLSVIPGMPDHAKAGIQCLFWLLLALTPAHAETDPETGLKIAPGYEQVKAQCTACHSGRLVAQNRADRDGWRQMIRWMQETQNLWPLGEAEEDILDYLAANYGPLPRGRRAPLDVTFHTPPHQGVRLLEGGATVAADSFKESDPLNAAGAALP